MTAGGCVMSLRTALSGSADCSARVAEGFGLKMIRLTGPEIDREYALLTREGIPSRHLWGLLRVRSAVRAALGEGAGAQRPLKWNSHLKGKLLRGQAIQHRGQHPAQPEPGHSANETGIRYLAHRQRLLVVAP